LCANVRSCLNKIDDLRITVQNQNVDILCITESWLHKDISDDIISLPNFSVVRDDRANRKGGGVAIWISNFQAFNQVLTTNHNNFANLFDCNCIFLHLYTHNILLIVIYIPPQSVINHAANINTLLIDSIDEFTTKFPDCELIVCGDFNGFVLDPLLYSFDLQITNNVQPTRLNAILDHVLLSSNLIDHYNITIENPISTSDHNSILCKPTGHFTKRLFFTRKVFDLRQSNIAYFIECISSIDWSHLFLLDVGVNDKCSIFHNTVLDCINNCIPMHVVEMSDRDPPWFTPLLKLLINQRWAAFRSRNFARYHSLKDIIKHKIVAAKANWAKRESQNHFNIWKVVNDIQRTKRTDPMCKLYSKFSDLESAANVLNDTLSKNFSSFDLAFDYSPTFGDIDDNDDWNLSVTVNDVFQALNSISVTKALGSDLIPTCLYKYAAPFIAEPLCHIFNLSISTKVFPDIWKLAHVICIPKCTNPTLNDIRPISLLALPSLIFERLVYKSLIETFCSNFGASQFGFKPLSSTCCALIYLHNFVTVSLDDPTIGGVQLLSYDFAKAFDSVSHSIIINSLEVCNFPPNFIKWVSSYLNNRRQSVRIGSTLSNNCRVTSGIPQGSVLGPALFSIVVSSFNCQSNSIVIKFADDFCLACPLFKNSGNSHILAEHNAFIDWSNSKKLTINNFKCCILPIITSSFTSLYPLDDFKNVDFFKLLGVTFSNKLSWDLHFKDIACRASRKLYAIKLIRNIMSKESCIKVYYGIIRSILEYCGPLFVGISKSNSNVLESIQRRAHIIICGRHCTCTNFPLLQFRRIQHSIKLYNSAFSNPNHPLHFIIPPSSQRRSKSLFIQPVSRTTRRLNSFIPCTTIHINSSL
jgi:hypothetical protein